MNRFSRQGGALLIGIVCALTSRSETMAAPSPALPLGWTSGDIGTPAIGGSTERSADTITIRGAGADIGGTSDEFHFAFQEISGDIDISVRVADLQDVNPGAKAGIMIRESLTADAKNAFMLVSHAQGLAFQWRSAAGHKTTQDAGAAVAAPVWLRLVRQDKVFRAYSSLTGAAWTLVGSAVISMSTNAYVGLAVTSHDPSQTATASFSNLALGSPAPASLPAPWAAGDIGDPVLPGSASASGGTFTVTGGGPDIWDGSDQFQFVYQPVTGDSQIVARVGSLDVLDGWTKAGVMIRESLSAPAANAFIWASGSNGWGFSDRVSAGGSSYYSAGSRGGAPWWVRLVREGDLFSAYQSQDGSQWTLVATAVIAMPATVYVGLAITSHIATATATATFSNVAISMPAGGNRPPTVSMSDPAAGASYTAPANIFLSATAGDVDGSVSRVDFYGGTQLVGSDATSPFSATWSNVPAGTYSLTAVATDNEGEIATSVPISVTVAAASSPSPSLPAPWAAGDIGDPTLPGGASASGGTFTVTGGGPDIWDGSDQFQFVYQPVTGDSQIVARVGSLDVLDGWTKAGVMIRESLSAPAANAFIWASGSNGWGFSDRVSTGGSSYYSAGSRGGAPWWVRLVREGDLFSAYQSQDGSQWTLVATAVIAMPATVYVGLAITSHIATATATATFSNVAISMPAGGNRPPTVSMSDPAAGASYTAPANIFLSATAGDVDGSVSRVDFYGGTQLVGSDATSPFSATWSNVPAGTYSLTAVATDNAGEIATSVPISVTVAAASSPSPSLPAPWAAGDVGNPALAGSASASGGTFTLTGAGVDIWDTSDEFQFVYQPVTGDTQIVARAGSLQGPDEWTKAGVMIREALTGPAAQATVFTTRSNGWQFTRRPSAGTFSYSTPGSAGTAPGWVRLVREGNLFSAYQSQDGSQWTLIDTETIPMPATVYVGLAITSHNATAMATATFSNVAISTPTGGNRPPTVSMSGPAAGASYTAPATIALSATAGDVDGAVSRVDFYAGTRLVGSDATSPFSATWSNVSAGTYTLTAVATDNEAATATSQPITVTVAGVLIPTLPTTLVFVPSPDDATNVTSYTVELRRSVDAVTASPVATRNLGKPAIDSGQVSVDISTLVDPLPAGSYYAVVVSTGPGGSTPSSASAVFSK